MIDFKKLLKEEFPENYYCEVDKQDMCQVEVIEGCENCEHFVRKLK